ncbi:MAG TPA: DMT family transporter [Acidimicrobiales bacterium]|nr:DMT family transporter [Acidimicrobiales bacterium]
MKFDVIVLALIASGFTAMASVAQRQAAAPAPEKLTFSWRLVGYLIRRPVWFLGIASMILGFVFQVEALRRGSLVLVQPLIATELVIVFGVIALHDRHRVHGRDWLSALGMVVGLGIFLALARPGGGHTHASTSMWALAGLTTFALAGVLAAMAYLPGRQGLPPSPARKAALLGIAAATGFGFVAAVVKELSSHLSQGPAALFSNWSPYVLLLSGAAAMFLASNAFQAGSLAASQPGLTIVDPLVASVLGVVLFGERVNHDPLVLAGEVGALVLLVASVVVLSQSPLVQEHPEESEKKKETRSTSRLGEGGWTPKAHLPALTRRQPSLVRARRMTESTEHLDRGLVQQPSDRS